MAGFGFSVCEKFVICKNCVKTAYSGSRWVGDDCSLLPHKRPFRHHPPRLYFIYILYHKNIDMSNDLMPISKYFLFFARVSILLLSRKYYTVLCNPGECRENFSSIIIFFKSFLKSFLKRLISQYKYVIIYS